MVTNNYFYCKNGCGQLIKFDDGFVSKTGQKIPLGENELPHECPKSPFILKNNMERKQTQRQIIQKNNKTDIIFEPASKIRDRDLIDNARNYFEELKRKLIHYTVDDLIVRGKEKGEVVSSI